MSIDITISKIPYPPVSWQLKFIIDLLSFLYFFLSNTNKCAHQLWFDDQVKKEKDFLWQLFEPSLNEWSSNVT